jgi:hypothetical protein
LITQSEEKMADPARSDEFSEATHFLTFLIMAMLR